MHLGRRSCLALIAAAAAARRASAAEPIRLGLLHTLSPAPLYIAQERGYFRDAGCDVNFVFFDAAQPIAAAAVAGDIDVGITALTGGFFALAGKGELKVIGGGLHEQKGYEGTQVLVSKKAYRRRPDLARQTPRPQLRDHAIWLLVPLHARTHRAGGGFDVKSVTLRPVQQVTNMLAAVRSGQVDATMAIASRRRRRLAATRRGKDHRQCRRRRAVSAHGAVHDGQDDHVAAGRCMRSPRRINAASPIIATASCDFRRRANRSTTRKPTRVIPLIEKYVFTGDPKAADKIKDGVGWYDEGARSTPRTSRPGRVVRTAGSRQRPYRPEGHHRYVVPADAVMAGLVGPAWRRAASATPTATLKCSTASIVVAEPGEVTGAGRDPRAAANRRCWRSSAACWRRSRARCGWKARSRRTASTR